MAVRCAPLGSLTLIFLTSVPTRQMFQMAKVAAAATAGIGVLGGAASFMLPSVERFGKRADLRADNPPQKDTRQANLHGHLNQHFFQRDMLRTRSVDSNAKTPAEIQVTCPPVIQI